MLQITVLCAAAAVLGVASACNFPPSLWCSTTEIAKECGVTEQCRNYYGSPDAAPVSITLYMESLCPDCKRFIKTQLYPTWRLLKNTGILNLTLVPYGNAEEEKVGDSYKFRCQHGEEECYGNLIETCAIHLTNTTDDVFPFVNCLEDSHETPRAVAKQCASDHDIDYTALMQCVESSLGNKLQHQMAQRTDSLSPPHQYVPWVTVNGVHTESLEQEAESNLKQLICNTYKGTAPHECERLRTRRCVRK